VVVGDDEVGAAAGPDVFGAAVQEPGRQVGVDAEAVGGAALQPCRELFAGVERLGIGAHVEGEYVADESAQDGLPAAGAELGAGPIAEGRG
jgi:hypothetical protein